METGKKKYSEGKPYKVIAFVLACFSNDEQKRVLTKVASECGKHRCKVVFFSTQTDFYYDDTNDAGEKKIFDTICAERFDAIILMSESFKQDKEQQELVNRARQHNVPVITVDKQLEGALNLSFDYGDTFRDIVRHMVEEHGYRKVNFMAGLPDNSFSDERLRVYEEVLRENGIPMDNDRIYYGYFWAEPTKIAMRRMIEKGLEDTEAIICANDAMAIAVCNCLMEKGYRVPEDIAVSGFDGIEMEKYCRPRLTTGVYDIDGLIQTIFSIVDGTKQVSGESVDIPIYNKIQIGQSCGCAGCETIHVASEMIELKADLHREIKYQSEMSQMVANCGNAEIQDVIKAIPLYMKPLQYKEFWFCANEGLLDGQSVMLNPTGEPESQQVYTDHMQVLYWENGEENGEWNPYKPVSIELSDLIPNLDKQFEEHDYLMVLTMHIKSRTVGYGVVTFDADNFWYTAYASFLTSISYIIDIQVAKVKMQQIYMFDSLTGLYNRNGFYQRIENLMQTAEDKKMTIVSLDMDRLKYINDTFGHAEGDEALKALAGIIDRSVSHEVAARIGGDEFLIAFVGHDIREHTEDIVREIKDGIRTYNVVSGKSYELHASIGAYTDAVEGNSLDHFLKNADDLMYARKYYHRRERGDI